MVEEVAIEEVTGLALASVAARKGHDAGSIGEAIGGMLPDGPSVVAIDSVTWIGGGPASWLAISNGGEADFAERIAEKLAGLASVSDQTGAYRVFRIGGDGARGLIQRGVAIDLDDAAFAPGSAATTVIAHIGVVIWRVDDAPDYRIAVFRTFAPDFQHWLECSRAAM